MEHTHTWTYGGVKPVFRPGQGKRGRGSLPALAAALALLALCAGVFWGAYRGWLRLPALLQQQIDLMPDLAAKDGTLTGSGPVAAATYHTVLNLEPTQTGGRGPCSIQFENPAANQYQARLCLYLVNSGELVANTHLVAPGKRVDTTPLRQRLEPGEYPVTAVIELFDQEKEPKGSVMLSITLRITE